MLINILNIKIFDR